MLFTSYTMSFRKGYNDQSFNLNLSIIFLIENNLEWVDRYNARFCTNIGRIQNA